MKASNKSAIIDFLSSQGLVYTFIVLGIAARLLPHPPNFTPISAIALFAGAYLGRQKALYIMVVAMLVSDAFLGFHATMPYVYFSFALIILLGKYLNRPTILKVAGATLVGSFLFFLVTNFGAWLTFNMYPHTYQGLIQAYIMGLPFYRNMLAGDLIYSGLFFGAYEVIQIYLNRRLAWQKVKSN